MKVSKLAWLAAAAIGMSSGAATAQQYAPQYGSYVASAPQPGQAAIQQVGHGASVGAAINCDCGQPVCGCEAVVDPAACGCGTACDGGCDSGCGVGHGLSQGLGLDSCCIGEPWSLFGEHNGWSAGGWAQVGYHSQRGGYRFNQHPDNVNLHQAWLYAEKAIDTTCGFDIGGRIDYVYGVDAQDTQAFGLDNGHWDTGWDNGIYGHAIPQLYLEAGYGDLSVKVGHFFTLIGYETVAATGNFFYSHAYTMYNSEPFTHTGVLAKYNVTEDVTAYGGYSFGWDSGFDDNGDSFLGGLSYVLTDDLSLTYATVAGRFDRDSGERGYMHSLVLNAAMTDRLQYIFQTDYLDTENADDEVVRNTFAINQYLIYKINDCWSAGTRVEWWNVNTLSQGFHGENSVAGIGIPGNADIYDVTFGLNYRPHANILVRPEVRVDYVTEDAALLNLADIELNEDNRSTQTTFGIDTIFLF